MQLNLLKKHLVLIILLLSTTVIFCDIDIDEINVVSSTDIQKPIVQKPMIFESKTDKLATELSFLNDQVLDQDLFGFEQQLAVLLRYEINSKFDSIESDTKSKKDSKLIDKKIEMLLLLVRFQKMAQAKLEILFAADDSTLTSREFSIIKLNILNTIYRDLQKVNKDFLADKINFKDLSIKYLNNNYVTKVVTSNLHNYGIYNIDTLLKVDVYNLWPKLYECYFNFINEYRNNKNSLFELDDTELNNILLKIQAQKNILLDIDFIGGFSLLVKKIFGTWAGRINNLEVEKIDDKVLVLDSNYYDSQRKNLEEQLKTSITVFDSFIVNLIRIKGEIENSKRFLNYLNQLDGSKKEIVIGHLVLIENEDFNHFMKEEDFASCFDAYNCVVKEYLDNDDLNENIFVYKLFSAISKLNSFRRKKEPFGFLAGFVYKNKETDSICSLTESMIDILEQISTKLKEKDGSSVVNAGIIERILNGEIKIPDKLQKIIFAAIQSVLG